MAKYKQLLGHTNENNAFVVDDYPYGYKLRCKIRYWIESKKSKNKFEQRFCSQTLNPKNNRWNAPKKSTYSLVMVLLINNDVESEDFGHVNYSSLSQFDQRLEVIEEFKSRYELTEEQLDAIKWQIAFSKVMEKVEFKVTCSSVGPVSLLSNKPEDIEKRKKIAEEQEEYRKKQKEVLKDIQKATAFVYRGGEL